MKMILKVLVGSKAHGLSDEHSDEDFRGVFIEPTESFLALNPKPKETFWQEGDQDNTFFEIKKFLNDAILGLPNTLEVFFAPVVEITPEGQELLDLFPYVWDKQKVYDSFIGYANNNLKKMLENKDGRDKKYACFLIRILCNLIILLEDNKINVTSEWTKRKILDIKESQELNYGLVLNQMRTLIKIASDSLKESKQLPDLAKVNEFLLKVRKNNYEC